AAILDADPRHRPVGGADEDDADRAAAHVEAAQPDRLFTGPARARPERHGTERRLGRLDEGEPFERQSRAGAVDRDRMLPLAGADAQPAQDHAGRVLDRDDRLGGAAFERGALVGLDPQVAQAGRLVDAERFLVDGRGPYSGGGPRSGGAARGPRGAGGG